jgi:hypothetical protein
MILAMAELSVNCNVSFCPHDDRGRRCTPWYVRSQIRSQLISSSSAR